MHDFFEVNLVSTFRRDVYSHIWSYVNKNEKKIIKNQKFKILKKKKWSGDMVDRYLSVKFGVIPLGGFRENDVYGWTTDGRRMPTS